MELKGTSLKEEDLAKELTVYFKPSLNYRWDTGIAIGRFLEELKNGRLIGKQCTGCERVLMPPRAFCEKCFRDTDEWIYTKDTGRVNTFSLCYITWDMKRLKIPQIPAVIEIDGSNGGFLHLINAAPDKVKINMKVKAVWKTASQRKGTITDIKYFVPA